MKTNKNYVFLLIESNNPEKWLKIKDMISKGENLIEFRFSKIMPNLPEIEDEDELDVLEGPIEGIPEEDLKAAKRLDKQYI